MAKEAVPRGVYLTLFTGAAVLVAVYYAARFAEWDVPQRFGLGLAALFFAGVVFLADWYVHRRVRH